MSINAGINGAGGQTKPRGSAPLALGPEDGATLPPAKAPLPLGPRALGSGPEAFDSAARLLKETDSELDVADDLDARLLRRLWFRRLGV